MSRLELSDFGPGFGSGPGSAESAILWHKASCLWRVKGRTERASEEDEEAEGSAPGGCFAIRAIQTPPGPPKQAAEHLRLALFCGVSYDRLCAAMRGIAHMDSCLSMHQRKC